MYTVFSGVKSLLKCKRLHIDHCVFRMHYKISVFFLLGSCALVGSKQYAGEPIKCSTDTQDYSSVVDTYCFITSTYTVKTAWNKTPVDGAPHPGIYHSQDSRDYRYHVYYQWIGFLLFFQAMLFYFPHWLWKNFEGGLLVKMLDREETNSNDPEVIRIRHRNRIVNLLRNRWCKEKFYCIKYFFCEFLCIINVIGQMFLLDKVFDGDYLHYGVEAVKYFYFGPTSVLNPFERIFPRVTSCTYRYFGEGGKVRKTSVLCVLAVNVINEKVFLFMWFWFVFLSILTAVALMYKLIVFSLGPLRLALLRASFKNVRGEDFRFIVENGDVGDYLLIYLLGQNTDQTLFYDVITELVGRFHLKHNSNYP